LAKDDYQLSNELEVGLDEVAEAGDDEE